MVQKETLSAGAKTRERFQEGIPLWPLGLSQWKLSRRRVRFSSLLILMGEFPSLSAMADATSCPETGTQGSQQLTLQGVPRSPPDE